MKRKKRKGKEGFLIEDRKKVKRKGSKEKQNNSRSKIGKEEMKRKKRRGKEGFPIEDQKKVKGKRSKEKQNNSRSIQETRKENRRSSDQINFSVG